MSEQLRLFAIVIALTILSGIGDSQGFLHAARVWHDGTLMWEEVVKSALGFAFGIVMYWIAIRYFQESGVTMPETQTIVWFAITIVGVAALSGAFVRWRIADQLIAITTLGGIGWLMFRTAA
jgi:hypothetical protein